MVYLSCLNVNKSYILLPGSSFFRDEMRFFLKWYGWWMNDAVRCHCYHNIINHINFLPTCMPAWLQLFWKTNECTINLDSDQTFQISGPIHSSTNHNFNPRNNATKFHSLTLFHKYIHIHTCESQFFNR